MHKPWDFNRYFKIALYLAAGAYVLHLAALGFLIGPFDYDHLSGYYELARRFWMTQSGAPAFDPFLCGGRTLGADPQIPIYSPLPFIVAVLGPTWTLKLEMLFQVALGSWGVWRLLKYWQVGEEGQRWGLFLFLAGGATAAKAMVGHVTLGFYLCLPAYLVLSYSLSALPWRVSHRVRAALWLLCVYCAHYKPNFLIYWAPVLFLEAAARSWAGRTVRPFIEYALACGVATLVNAPTFLPAWRYFTLLPRLDGSAPQTIAPYALLANLLLPLKAIPKAFYGPGFLQRHEYNIFLGPVALFFVGQGWTHWKTLPRTAKASILALGLGGLLFGFGSPTHAFSFWPYTWFHHVWPGFNSVRVPTRFWFFISFVLILLSSFGFRIPRSPRLQSLVLLAGVAPLLANVLVNVSKTSYLATQTQWSQARAFPAAPVLVHNHPDDQYRHLRAGNAVEMCTDNIQIFKTPGLRPDQPLLSSEIAGQGQNVLIDAHWNSWSEIGFRAVGGLPFQLSFNLNHSPFWRLDGEGTISSTVGERLTVSSDGTRATGTLYFDQPWVRQALWIGVLSSVGLGIYIALSFFKFPKQNSLWLPK